MRPSAIKVVLAAGGLLTRGKLARKIAIVHRPKYNDWSLPKGKLEPGETCEQAAQREVCEETRCRGRLGRFAGLTQYHVEAGLKLVLFWHMEVETDNACELGDDVDQVLWVNPDEAVAKLSHQAEKAIVRREFAGWRARLVHGWDRITGLGVRPLGQSLQYLRLESAIESFRAQLDWRRAQEPRTTDRPRDDSPAWFVICTQLLAAAQEALRAWERDKAWACFEAAQRMEVFGFNEDELRARAFALRAEARDKMTGWRGKAIQEILPDAWLVEGRPAADVSVGAASSSSAETVAVPANRPAAGLTPARWQVALAQGLHLRDEHFQNNYFKLALINWQIRLLIYNLLLVLALILLMAQSGALPAIQAAPEYDFALYVAVVLFGALGGTLSVLLTLGNAPSDSRIPEAINTHRGYILRPFLGAAAALVTLLFLAAGILDFGVISNAKVLTISFIAGFSERFLLSAVSAAPTQPASAGGR